MSGCYAVATRNPKRALYLTLATAVMFVWLDGFDQVVISLLWVQVKLFDPRKLQKLENRKLLIVILVEELIKFTRCHLRAGWRTKPSASA